MIMPTLEFPEGNIFVGADVDPIKKATTCPLCRDSMYSFGRDYKCPKCETIVKIEDTTPKSRLVSVGDDRPLLLQPDTVEITDPDLREGASNVEEWDLA